MTTAYSTAYNMNHLTDKDQLRAYFNQDRPLFAYALGDLDDHMWPVCTFLGIMQDGDIQSLALIWRGVDPPGVLVFGPPQIAEELIETLPDEIFYLIPADLLPLIQRYYTTPHNIALWRMNINQEAFQPVPAVRGLRRLTGEDAPLVQALFEADGPRAEMIAAITASQINAGVFFGIEVAGRLIAVAGTHVCSSAERVGAVGYVYTTHAARGQGYATAATSAVTQTFFEMGIDTVILNVAQDNTPAIRAYEKLGYHIYTAIAEGPATKKH